MLLKKGSCILRAINLIAVAVVVSCRLFGQDVPRPVATRAKRVLSTTQSAREATVRLAVAAPPGNRFKKKRSPLEEALQLRSSHTFLHRRLLDLPLSLRSSAPTFLFCHQRSPYMLSRRYDYDPPQHTSSNLRR
jgi:hypothetical protein